MSDGYQTTSYTSSGWTISTNPQATPEQRWRAVHPEHGTRYFKTREEILPFTCEHMVKQATAFLRAQGFKL